MIEYLAYDFGLILFTRFKAFKKYRDALSFKWYLILSLVTIIVFIMSCFKILTEDNFMGVDTRNPVIKKIVFLLFIGTKATLGAYVLSGYLREQSDLKTSIAGKKGVRGRRGEGGIKADKCDNTKCNLGICDKKILDYVSEVYSEILKKKGKKSSKHYKIINHFLTNKIKLLCGSPQLNKLLMRENKDKAYTTIKETWSKWINIIMKYKNGEYFIETDYLIDNDFDNLIDIEDSNQTESPFDEIKKYDMWYWGEPQEAKVNIKYEYDKNNDNNNISILESDNYTNTWRSSVALQTKNGDTYTQFLPKGSNTISVYKPNIVSKNENDKEVIYKPMGDVVLEGDIDKAKLKPTKLVSGNIKSPIDFKKIYSFQRSEGPGKNIIGYHLWEPIPPENYKCLGYMLTNKFSDTKPNKNEYACIPNICSKLKNEENTIIDSYKKNDIDEVTSNKLEVIYVDTDTNLMQLTNKSDKLIIEGEEHSCINNNNTIKGKWIVNNKNDEEYSINAFFKKKE